MNVLTAEDPQRLGDYWLAGRLGVGGQGVVYEGYAEDGARVAIKVLHGDEAGRLAKEAETARRVASFCTARVLAAELDGPRPYIVSEYVAGPSLRQAIAGGRRFLGGDLHRLATAVATALTAIHEAGVVHRDLKPDNVLLGPDGPRVIDFGIARTAEMSLTATGLVTGTPTYMAPEVFGGQRAGAPADVFAWGCVVLYAATGADPFEAESLGGVMHRVLSATPDLSALPESLRPLVSAALSKEPGLRPEARQLLLALVSGDGGLDTGRLLERGRAAARVAGTGGDPALGTLAEDSYELLAPAERELAPEVFLRLFTVDGQGELAIRRARLDELVAGRPAGEVPAVTRILEVFAYLLGRDGEQVWLARPALPHAWPRLRRWIEANREGLAVHAPILAAVRRWDEGGRRDGGLFHGTMLDEALNWAATVRRDIRLSQAERDFLESSARLGKRRARRARLLTLSLAGLLRVALAAGGVAVQQSRVAAARADELHDRLTTSESTRLAARSEAAGRDDPVLAGLLAVAAWRLRATPQARAALTAALARRERGMFRDPAAARGTLRALAADGRTLLSVGQDAARLWDVRTGRRTTLISGLGLGGERVTDIGLSPSGRTLVAATARRARAWDTATGRPISTWPRRRSRDLTEGWTEAVRRHEGRKVIVRPDDSGQWNVADAADPAARRGTQSPDGRWLAMSGDGTLTLTQLKEGWTEEVGEGTEGAWNKGGPVFDRSGRLLATVTDTTVQFWRLPDTHLLSAVPVRGDGDTGTPPAAAFDGTTFRYLVGDQVFAVDVADLLTEPAEGPPYERADFGEDGLHLVMDGTLHPVGQGGPVQGGTSGRLPASDALGFSRDGRRLALLSGHDVTVLDTATRKPVAAFTAGTGGTRPQVVRFSPDGGRVALVLDGPGSGTDAVELWDWQARRRLWSTRAGGVVDLAFSPDGGRLALTGLDVRLLRAADGKAAGSPFGAYGQGVLGNWVRFTHAGDGVVVFDSRGRMSTWDAGGRRLVEETEGFAYAGTPAYSPAEDLVAVDVGEGRVRLIDPRTGTDLGRSADPGGGLDRDEGELLSVAFTPDGSHVLTVDAGGTVGRVPAAAGLVERMVCDRAGRALTEREWRTYVPALPYRPVCG
ncbi:serine/threonine-protein kinase [Nonomuraea sp. WAC 01424]|uniref:serine/threonine-protein kinase n=1 Tax=Nonomuraea sp. WAC 01424 TaxID=2203200 RepID=UPI00163C1113|nr:serine/threonine-protein kinase [Nonomuraea sp. WAC 01424]